MSDLELGRNRLLAIRRCAARELRPGDWISLTIIALVGLIPIMGTLFVAWWMALS